MKAGTCKRPRFFRLFCSVFSIFSVSFFAFCSVSFSALLRFFSPFCSVPSRLCPFLFRLLNVPFFGFCSVSFALPASFRLFLRFVRLCPFLSALLRFVRLCPFLLSLPASFRLLLRSFSHFPQFLFVFCSVSFGFCSVSFRLLFRFFRSFLSTGKYAPNGRKHPFTEPTFIVKKQLCFSPQKNIAEVQQFGATASHIDEQRQKEKAS